MDDKTLQRFVMDELEFEPGIDPAHIGVVVDRGVVTLSGHVRSYAEKLRVEDAVNRIRGVRAVAQEIEVRYPSDKKTADDEIARRAIDILAWDVSVPAEKIKVQVQHGWVTLSGEVDFHFEKLGADMAVRKLTGVLGVDNQITIRPTAVAGDVKRRIEDALRRHAAVEADGIRVIVEDGKVTLEGRVRAWHERRVAEQAAWAARGVRSVDDHLQIG